MVITPKISWSSFICLYWIWFLVLVRPTSKNSTTHIHQNLKKILQSRTFHALSILPSIFKVFLSYIMSVESYELFLLFPKFPSRKFFFFLSSIKNLFLRNSIYYLFKFQHSSNRLYFEVLISFSLLVL